MIAGEEASAARRAASPASAALPLYAGIPLAGAASASGSWAGPPAGVAARCGVLGGGFGVAPPLVNVDTEVPWPAAAFCRIRSGRGPGIKCACAEQQRGKHGLRMPNAPCMLSHR